MMSYGMAVDPVTLLPVSDANEPPGPTQREKAAIDWMAGVGMFGGQELLRELQKMLTARIELLVAADPQAQTLLEVARRIDSKTAMAANAIDSLIARNTKNWKAAGHGITQGPDQEGTAP